MGEKEQVKQDLRQVFNQLKNEIFINNNEFDQDFEEIIKLFEEKKMEMNEISPLDKEDQELFIEYYRKANNYGKEYIKDCLESAKYDYQKTLDIFKEDEKNEKSNDDDY